MSLVWFLIALPVTNQETSGIAIKDGQIAKRPLRWDRHQGSKATPQRRRNPQFCGHRGPPSVRICGAHVAAAASSAQRVQRRFFRQHM